MCYLWDLAAQRPVISMKGHHDFIHSVAARSSHCQAVSGSEDGSARLWDWRSGKCTSVLDVWRGVCQSPSSAMELSSPWVGCVGMDTSENWAVLGCGGRSLCVWSLVADAPTARIATSAPPQAVVLTRDGITAACAEPWVSRWSLSGEPMQRVPCTPTSAFALSIHPSSMMAIGGSTHGAMDVLSGFGSCIASLRSR